MSSRRLPALGSLSPRSLRRQPGSSLRFHGALCLTPRSSPFSAVIISPCLYSEATRCLSSRSRRSSGREPTARSPCGPPPLPSTPRCPPAYPSVRMPRILGARESPSSVRHLIQGPQQLRAPLATKKKGYSPSFQTPTPSKLKSFSAIYAIKPIRPSQGWANTGSCTVTPSPGNPSAVSTVTRNT